MGKYYDKRGHAMTSKLANHNEINNAMTLTPVTNHYIVVTTVGGMTCYFCVGKIDSGSD